MPEKLQQCLMALCAGAVMGAMDHTSCCSHGRSAVAGLHGPMRWPSRAQGSVFRARWRGTQVAVKSINHCSSGETNLAVSREVMVGQVMSHPNLVSSPLWPAPSTFLKASSSFELARCKQYSL